MDMHESGRSVHDAGVEQKQGCACGTGNCRSFRLGGDSPAGSGPTGSKPRLPSDAVSRKALPIGTAVLDYFPLALAAIAEVSLAGQRQHGTTGWDRSKSKDHADALIRHFLERGTVDTDGLSHAAKMAWRALAILQEEREALARAA